MPNFFYVDKGGNEKTVQANSVAEAQRLAKDIDPKSGFREERSLPSLAETGKDTRELPVDDNPSKLVSFTRTVQRATALARQARNKIALATTGQAYPEGVLPDFGSILGNLNASSENFSSDLIEELEKSREGDEGTYELRTVGKNLIQFQLGPSGEVIGQKVIASAPAEGGGSDGPDFFSTDSQRDIMQGRLSSAQPEVQVAFARTPKEFRDSWIRNNIQYDNAGVTLPALLSDLESWERYQTEKKATDDIPAELFPAGT